MNKLQINRMATTVLFAVLVLVSSVALAQKPIKRPPKKVRQTTTQQVAKPPKKTVAPAKTSKPTTPVKPVEVEESVAPAKPTKGELNGHEWVDLGLSVKWATMNVGADSPSDYGDYFAWGETNPKSEYTEENCETWGLDLSDISGNSEYDAARANWGGSWRIPTANEFNELKVKCKWEWSTIDGINGYTIYGPNGKFIFLPAAGFRKNDYIYDLNLEGYYWNSYQYEFRRDSKFRGSLSFSVKVIWEGAGYHKLLGNSIRPVTE